MVFQCHTGKISSYVPLHCSCLHHVWSSPCLATVQTALEAGMWSAGLFLSTHTHTHRLLTGCYHLLAQAHTSSWPPGGWRVVGGWAGFLAAPRLFTPSQTPFLSTQGLLCQVSVTIALCLSLQIANRCPESESLTDIPSRGGWVGLCCV